MADHSRILSNRLGQLAQRDACMHPELHDIELLRPAVPVGAVRPPLRPVEKVPFDVWFVIFSGLEYSDALAFTRTCRAFYSFAPSEALVTVEQRHRFYLKAERFRQNDGLLVCFSCTRLRPRNCFGDKQKNNRRGKHGLHPDEAMKRHCWDCAAAGRLYLETQPLRKDGHLWHLCHQCGIFKHGSQRCLTEDSHETGDGSTAGNRRGGSGRRIICTPAWPASVPSALESRLPAALQDQIVGHLGYRDRISLAATNRHFRQTVRPLDAPLSDKVAVVKQAANWTGSAPAPGPWACMVCFRARPAASFHSTEWSQSKWWQRRCRACCDFISRGGIPQQGAANPSRQWHPLRMCWLCRELTYVGGKCGNCNDQGPEWDRMRELQARREERRERAATAADADMSEPLSLLMMDEEDVLGEAARDVEPVQIQASDHLGGTTATTQSKEGQGREAVQDGGGDEGTRCQVGKEQLPGEHAAGVAAVFAGRSQSASSHIYHRLQRFLPDGHPLRRHHRQRTTWGVIERLKNALLAR